MPEFYVVSCQLGLKINLILIVVVVIIIINLSLLSNRIVMLYAYLDLQYNDN